ncbi:MAG: hypothetical protein HQK99_10555 [Nitrospirae bacterium]|nr:hypothetical protein [Nitrospirota bacterium]
MNSNIDLVIRAINDKIKKKRRSDKILIKTIVTLLIVMLLPVLSFADVPSPNTYTLKARLALKSEKHQVLTTLPFHWNMNMITPDNSGNGWIEKKGCLIWLPGGKRRVFKMPLEISKLNGGNAGRPTFPRDFKELWIEYKDISPQTPCEIGVMLNFNPDADVKKVKYDTAIGGSKVPLNIETINVAGLDDKDLRYTKDWHFSSDNLSVIKKRLHKDISTIDKANLGFSPGTKIKAIYLRLAFKDSSRSDETVIWDKLPKTITTDKDETTVSIWLGRYLRKSYPNEGKVFIEELIVHLNNHIDQVVKNRPFKRLTLIWSEYLLMAGKTDETDTEHKTIKVDISELSDIYGRDGRDGGAALKQASLYVTPSNVNSYCGLRLKRIMAVNSYEGERPVVISAIDNMNKGFGGPFMELSGDDDNVEALKFLNYHSFGNLNKSKIMEISVKQGPFDNSTGMKESLMDGHNVKITTTVANSPHTSMSCFKDNEQVKERKAAARIEILWSTSIMIKDNTYFIIRLAGGTEFVKSGVMTLKSERGEQFKRVFKPDMPLDLTGIRGRITEISLNMDLHEGPFTVRFKDMALFSPVSLPLAEAMEIRHPLEVTEPLYPEIDNKSGTIDASRGILNGVVLRSDLARGFQWNTRVENKTGIRGVHLDFINSRTVNPESPCWLSLTFIGERQRLSRDVCSESLKGQVYIPLPDIFAYGGADKLRLIQWKLDMGKQIVDNSQPWSFNYKLSIDRMAGMSISELITDAAILSVGEKNLYPMKTTIDFTTGQLSAGAWLDMGSMVIDNITNDIKVLDNPYVEVTSFVAERVFPDGQHYIPEFEEKGKVIMSPWPHRLLKTGIALFILASAVLGWIDRWWQRLWQNIKYGIVFIRGYLGIIREKTWAKLLPGNLHKMIFWIVLSGVMYGLNPEGTATNSSCLSVGGLFGFMAFRSLSWLMRPMIIRQWSAADQRIYKESGNVDQRQLKLPADDN